MGGSIAIAVMMEGCSGVVICIMYYPIMFGELQYYGLRRAETMVVIHGALMPSYHSISTEFPQCFLSIASISVKMVGCILVVRR